MSRKLTIAEAEKEFGIEIIDQAPRLANVSYTGEKRPDVPFLRNRSTPDNWLDVSCGGAGGGGFKIVIVTVKSGGAGGTGQYTPPK